MSSECQTIIFFTLKNTILFIYLLLLQIGDEIADADVDSGTEAFQFIGAFHLLLELGSRAMCSLEIASRDAVRFLYYLSISVRKLQ